MYVSRNDASIDQGDVASKVRRDEERRSLAEGWSTRLSRDQCETSRAGAFVAPFLIAKKDCAQFIKWKGDAGGLNHIRGEKVRARGQRLQLPPPYACILCPFISGPQILDGRREAGGAISRCRLTPCILCCVCSSCAAHDWPRPARPNPRRRHGRRRLVNPVVFPLVCVASKHALLPGCGATLSKS